MALLSGSNALDSEFTPAVGTFIASASRADAVLLRANVSGADFAFVGIVNGAVIVDNPIAGAVYKWAKSGNTIAAVRADQ